MRRTTASRSSGGAPYSLACIQVQEPRREHASAKRDRPELRHEPATLEVGVELLEREVCTADDACEEIVEVVHDGGCGVADRGEPLRAAQLGLEASVLGLVTGTRARR